MTDGAMDMLGAADWVVMGQWTFNVLLTIGLAYVASKNRQVEKLQDEVKSYARGQVKNEVALLAAEMRTTLAPMQEAVRQINERLGRGDAALDALWDGDHQIELKLAGKMESLKDWMRSEFASRDEQKEILTAVNAMQREMAVVKAERWRGDKATR